jgi:resuscitation-promoting factor RpfB
VTATKLIWVVTKSVTATTQPASNKSASSNGSCHPAYDPCVPIASDVDCAGGSGNGPEYVEGPITVKVIGVDPYRLDADDDGIGCEKN